MIEQLLWFFLALLWLEPQDNDIVYYWSGVELTGYLSTGDTSYDMNYQEIQKHIIIEDYFLFTERLWKINYARWCAGEATPPTYKNGKRYRCWVRSFDCGGMMKYYWWIKWIIDQKELAYLNAEWLYKLWEPKDPRTAERWDFMFWTSEEWNHFALITTGYNEVNHTLTIRDAVKNSTLKEREIHVSCNDDHCNYMWKYRISISTNGMVEEANRKWIQVNAFRLIE
jgi:hypothetical protein